MTHPEFKRLGELKNGERACVIALSAPESGSHATTAADLPPMARRLMEMGFLPGAEVELLHEAPVSRDPIAVRVRGTIIAVRRQEANWVEVQC